MQAVNANGFMPHYHSVSGVRISSALPNFLCGVSASWLSIWIVIPAMTGSIPVAPKFAGVVELAIHIRLKI